MWGNLLLDFVRRFIGASPPSSGIVVSDATIGMSSGEGKSRITLSK